MWDFRGGTIDEFSLETETIVSTGSEQQIAVSGHDVIGFISKWIYQTITYRLICIGDYLWVLSDSTDTTEKAKLPNTTGSWTVRRTSDKKGYMFTETVAGRSFTIDKIYI